MMSVAEPRGIELSNRLCWLSAGNTPWLETGPAAPGPDTDSRTVDSALPALPANSTILERPQLSAREREVLRAWLYSDSKREIADRLHLSVGTVTTYVARVRGKYAAIGRPANTKSALMARALQDGLVSIDDF